MVYRELTEEESGDLARRILFEDNHLLVFNKRVGEIVQGDKTGDEPLCETLKAFVAQRDGKPGRVFMGVPHRLDRPVSGICVFAKTSKCLERLNALFREGDVHKTYWALTCARPTPAEGELVHWLSRNEKQNKSFAYPATDPSQSAGDSRRSAGEPFHSADGSHHSAADPFHSADGSRRSAGEPFHSADGSHHSAADPFHSADGSRRSAGNPPQSAGDSRRSAGEPPQSADASRRSAGEPFHSADGSHHSAADPFHSADGSRRSAGGSRHPADAKLAKLRYRVLRDTDRYHLVEVELLTGRHHQIRCQLAAIGCPIKGDLKYGAPRSNPDGGISLHARHISFDHPVRHTPVTLDAPVTWPQLR